MAEDTSAAAATTPEVAKSEVGKQTAVGAPEASTPSKAEDTQDDNVEDKVVDSEAKDSAPNGNAVPATSAEDSASKDPSGEDIMMKDVAATSSTTTAPAAPSTPATTKKTPNGSTKKKSNAVPEHKTRKLNKKKSKPTLNLYAKPGEMYLARMKGHQPWPSIICDEEMLPQSLLSTRPVTTTLSDGSFKKDDYAPGGKREAERTFPIMFLYTNEFAWLPNTELTPISPDDCKEIVEKGEKGKSKGLIEAYKVATEGHGLDHYKGLLSDHQKALDEEAERKAEREAKKAEKVTKRKRKSIAAVDEDAMDVDEEDPVPKSTSKKRKKSMLDEDTEEKPAKTPKTKLKLNVAPPATPSESASKKKATSKTKSASKKAAAKVSTSDDELDTPKVDEQTLTPEEAREKKEKEIRYYRHKLQKGFITRDYTPGEDEIKSMSSYLAKLEQYPDLEGGIIRKTKINKVLKAMIRLSSIPKDEEYNFKKRSQDLLAKWNVILNSDMTGAEEGKDEKEGDEETKGDKADGKIKVDQDSKPETNGIKASEGSLASPKEEEKAQDIAKSKEKSADLAKDTESAASEENKIGTVVEGEKEAEEKPEKDDKSAEASKTDEPNLEKPAEAYQPSAEAPESTADA